MINEAAADNESHVHLLGRAATLAIADAAAKGCAFFAAVVAARVFGEAAFGALNFAQAVTAYGLILAGSWLEVYAVKTATQTPEQLGAVANTVVRLRLAIGAAVFMVLGLVSFLTPSLRAVLPLVLLYGLSVFTGALSLQWITQAVRKTHVMGVAVFTGQATYLTLVLTLVQVIDAAWTVPLALVIGEVVTVIGLYFWAKRAVTRLAEPLSLRDSLAFLRRAAPIGIAQLVRTVAIGSDLIVVGMLFPLADVGVYGASYKIYLLGISAIALYIIVLFPKILRTARTQPRQLSWQIMLSVVVMLVLGSPVLIGGWLFAGEVLGWVFGSGFAAGGNTMRLLLITLVLYAVTAHLRLVLIAFEKQHIDALLVGVAAVVHVIVKIGLASRLGVEGVALGALIGEATLLILMISTCRRIVRSASQPTRLPLTQ